MGQQCYSPEIDEGCKMNNDAHGKRAKFIVNVIESFAFASPVEILHATKTYCGSLYGCMLWKFDS